jgi:branched-chain amino acid transport system permease protein
VTAAAALFLVAATLPLFFDQLNGFIDHSILALAYVVMALGLNIVVGFAGLLDLGYVVFYAVGAYGVGWFASQHFATINHNHGIHILVKGAANRSLLSHTPAPGIHVSFLLLIVIAVVLAAIVGAVIGLPTLRLRGDYIAIVTLAFGEIIHQIAVNGDTLHIGKYFLTEGRNSISPVDDINGLPFLKSFDQATNIRPYYWTGLVLVLIVLFMNFRLRDSRLGRAWIALREDEVAAASMGVPLVKTKLLAYSVGAACGGVSGAFLGTYIHSVNADSFRFSFSIFVLSMVILGGLSSIWGVVFGAVALTYINYYVIPDLLNPLSQSLFSFDLTQLSFGIFGFLLVIMMVLRPEGLLPERRRRQELKQGVGGDEQLIEARA